MALTIEVTNDPLVRGYSAMTDLEVANSLNTKDIAVRRDVQWSTVFKWAMTEGFWQGTVKASKDSTHAAYDAALAAVELKDIFRGNGIDTGHAMFSSLADNLVSAGLMTAGQKATLVAMGDTLISRATQLGLPFVKEVNVWEVRR